MKLSLVLLSLLLQRLYAGDILRQGEICQIGNAWESKDVAGMRHRHLLLHQGDDEDDEFYDHDDDETLIIGTLACVGADDKKN